MLRLLKEDKRATTHTHTHNFIGAVMHVTYIL